MLQTPLQITVCCPPRCSSFSPSSSHLTLHLPSPSSPKSVPLASLLYPLPALFFFPSSFSFVLDLPLSPPFNSLFSLSHFLPFFTPPPLLFPSSTSSSIPKFIPPLFCNSRSPSFTSLYHPLPPPLLLTFHSFHSVLLLLLLHLFLHLYPLPHPLFPTL